VFARLLAVGLAVLGFQSEGSPTGLIARNARAMSVVGVDGVNLTPAGGVSAPDQAALGQLRAATAAGLPAVLLIGNWSDRINDFSEPLAHRVLGNAAAITADAATLAADVRADGWSGISVDLESLAPRDRSGLTAFLAALRADLPPADSLSMCVTNFTSLGQYAVNGYDLAGIAASAGIVLMAYDEHGPWENTPGPVGALSWQRAGLRALLRVVPAPDVLLGVAGYGYAWRPHSNVMLSDAQARALVRRWHARARFVATVGEWTARLGDGSTLWWSDARSFALRVRLARQFGVRGLAVWSLGLSDPL
jgi:spore germination protein